MAVEAAPLLSNAVSVLHRLVACLNRAESPAYNHALDALQDILGVSRSAVLLVNDHDVIRLAAWRGISEACRRTLEGYLPWPRATSNASAILVSDVSADERAAGYAPAFGAENIRAAAFIPVLYSGRILGTLMFYYDTPHDFTQDEVIIAETVAAHVAAAAARQQVQTRLADKEVRLQMALAAAQIGVWEWNIGDNAVQWSDRVYEIHGMTPQQGPVDVRAISKSFHPDDHDKVTQAVLGAVASRGSYRIEVRIRRPSGEWRWIDVAGTVVCNDAGTPLRVLGTTIDITERKQLELARQNAAAIVDWSSDAIISKDLNGDVTSWNRGAERLFGYTAEEMIGRPIRLLAVPGSEDEMPRIFDCLRRGERVEHYETQRRHKDGRVLDVSLTISPIRNAEGAVIGASKIARDITERKRSEEQLRAANESLRRMNEDLRQFSFAASHDLKEPLRHITIYAELLASEYKSQLDETGRRYLTFCTSAAQQMYDLVTDLQAYIDVERKSESSLPPIPLSEVLESVRANLGALLAETSTQLNIADLPAVAVFKPHLLQLFQNLIDNAIKYRHPDRPPVINIQAHSNEQEWIFEIEDNGIGIDRQHYQKIFEVFRRLHSDRPGTGIGLAICQRIVERYGGRIGVHSELGVGSKFFFAFPVRMIRAAG